MTSLWLKTRPYTLIDAINRKAAATGSERYARLSADAEYNGNHVSVAWNEYRRYWVAEYWWAGRIVLARGSFDQCLRAAKDEYDRGALGATVLVSASTLEEVAFARSLGFETYSKEIADSWYVSWADDRYAEVEFAMRWEAQFGVPATKILLESSTVEEFHERIHSYRREVRP